MKPELTVTLLCENTVWQRSLLAEHGFAVHLQYGDKAYLFDTGQGCALTHNALQLKKDLTLLNGVILSHGHDDHTGGLMHVVTEKPDVHLYMHPDALLPHWSAKRGEKPYDVSMPPDVRHRIETHQLQVTWTRNCTEITNGMHATGAIPRTYPSASNSSLYCNETCTAHDDIPDDQSVWVETEKGIVIITGCAHAGIENILAYISDYIGEDKIYALIGGFHVRNSHTHTLHHIDSVITRYNIQKIIPCHCTGVRATAHLCKKFNRACTPGHVGNSFTF